MNADQIMLNVPLLYFRHPRYVWISWPLILSGIASLMHPAFALLTVISIYNRCRIFWRLPHEKKWLELIEAKVLALDSAGAQELLKKPPFFTGYTARLYAEQLHVRVLLRSGEEMEAQRALFKIDTSGMTTPEKTRYQALLATFYQQTGDIKAFLDVARAWQREQVLEHTENTLLKGQALREEGDLVSAREYLEARLEREDKSEDLLLLYNDLASVSGLIGRRSQQREYLESAWEHWRKKPEPGAMYYLAHNLAISRIHGGQRAGAERILHEAYERLDKNSPDQILMWHNLCVEVAREAGDKEWLEQSRVDLTMHCETLQLTDSQRLSLAISQLRMDLNDGLNFDFIEFLGKLNSLLDGIDVLDETEQPIALKEITHNLEQIVHLAPRDKKTQDAVLETYSRCDQMMLDRSEVITKQLQALPPTLINRRRLWLGLQQHVYKIHIRRSKNLNEKALSSLLQTKKESAELYQEKGAMHEALQAWIEVCDEYVAYMHQLPPDMQSRLRGHAPLALHALSQIESLLAQRKPNVGLEEYMIGAAFFCLQLRKDQTRARYWIDCFSQSGVSLSHYALWLRRQYAWVQSVLVESA